MRLVSQTIVICFVTGTERPLRDTGSDAKWPWRVWKSTLPKEHGILRCQIPHKMSVNKRCKMRSAELRTGLRPLMCCTRRLTAFRRKACNGVCGTPVGYVASGNNHYPDVSMLTTKRSNHITFNASPFPVLEVCDIFLLLGVINVIIGNLGDGHSPLWCYSHSAVSSGLQPSLGYPFLTDKSPQQRLINGQ